MQERFERDTPILDWSPKNVIRLSGTLTSLAFIVYAKKAPHFGGALVLASRSIC
jgi:hypothetical protein